MDSLAHDAAVVVAVFAIAVVTRFVVRLMVRSRRARGVVVYRVRLPEEVDRARLAQVLAGAAATLPVGGLCRPWLGFELGAAGSDVTPRVVCSGGVSAALFESVIAEAIPGAKLVVDERAQAHKAHGWRAVGLVPSGRGQMRLRTEFAADPSGLLLRLLGDQGTREGAMVQLLCAAAPGAARARVLAEAAALRAVRQRRSGVDIAFGVVLGLVREAFEFFDRPSSGRGSPAASRPSPVALDRAKALERKANEPLFSCSLRVAVSASSRRRAAARLRHLSAAFACYRAEGGLRRGVEPRCLRRLERRTLPLRPRLLLAASEVAALCPFPQDPSQAPVALEQAPAREQAPSARAPQEGLLLGESDIRGRRGAVFISPRALLQHIHVLGPTGAGKSTLLLNVACQAMQHGLGVVVLEPKGDLVAEVLRRVPRKRRDDVVVLDFADRAFPPAYNLLAGAPGQGEAVAAIFSRLFGGYWGPRSDDLLRAAILTLEGGHRDGTVPTLADVLPLLSDARRRAAYRVHDTVVLQGFWQAWERASEGQRQQALAPLANKLRAFLLREPLRDALVQPEAPNLVSAIRDAKIVLCSASTSALSDDGSSLLGSVLLHRVWLAAQTLGPAANRRPMLCLIDEAHRFAALPGGIDDVLAQARGYGLGFVLAHQQLAQLSGELREAIAVNCRTKVCFQLDPPDNQRMARHFEPHLDASDLLHLDRYQAACRVCEESLVLPAATAVTPRAPDPNDADVSNDLQRRGRTKRQVDALIAKRFPQLERPAKGTVAPDATGVTGGTFEGTPDVPPNVPGTPRRGAESGGARNPDRDSPNQSRDGPARGAET